MQTNVSEIDLREPPGYFRKFHERYLERFKTKTRDVGDKAMDYMLGGFLDKKLTLTNIPEVVPDTNNQRLHHFISESPWKWEPVIRQLQKDASGLIGGGDSAFFIHLFDPNLKIHFGARTPSSNATLPAIRQGQRKYSRLSGRKSTTGQEEGLQKLEPKVLPVPSETQLVKS